MVHEIIMWNIYEVSSKSESLNGVMLRGRIRKLGIYHRFNVLVENTEDTENGLRFATTDEEHTLIVTRYIESILKAPVIELKLKNIVNPVLSKLKINTTERYEI